jgi:DNA-nicking Smr family endonuclease
MTHSADEEKFRPFKDLDRLLRRKKVILKSAPPPDPAPAAGPAPSPQQEAELFKEAMADVTPLAFGCYWQLPRQRLTFESFQSDEERETVEALHQLIESGQGFVVADTSEYMEATAPGVASEIARQLHSGRYSVQDHVDLHGLTAREADGVLHVFIKKAISEGKRVVLVVHGRGLTSPRKPVLKQKVYLWLTRGPLRKHVIALTSARSCDGGTGATYVLLRRTPMTKRMRKASRLDPAGQQGKP